MITPKTVEPHHYQMVLLQQLQALEMVEVYREWCYQFYLVSLYDDRRAIQSAQGESFKAGFMSGISSAFDVGTKAFGSGAGGFIARTTAMGIVGGTASALGGGKFSNGARSGAFVHMFNTEGGARATTNVIGKVWNSLNTAIGLAYGGLGHVVGLAMGTNPSYSIGHNAVQFTNNPFGGVGAITLGNTVTYGLDTGPGSRSDDLSSNIMWEHEIQHTYQGELLGPLYLPANAVSMATGLVMDGDIHGAHAFMETGPSSFPPRKF